MDKAIQVVDNIIASDKGRKSPPTEKGDSLEEAKHTNLPSWENKPNTNKLNKAIEYLSNEINKKNDEAEAKKMERDKISIYGFYKQRDIEYKELLEEVKLLEESKKDVDTFKTMLESENTIIHGRALKKWQGWEKDLKGNDKHLREKAIEIANAIYKLDQLVNPDDIQQNAKRRETEVLHEEKSVSKLDIYKDFMRLVDIGDININDIESKNSHHKSILERKIKEEIGIADIDNSIVKEAIEVERIQKTINKLFPANSVEEAEDIFKDYSNPDKSRRNALYQMLHTEISTDWDSSRNLKKLLETARTKTEQHNTDADPSQQGHGKYNPSREEKRRRLIKDTPGIAKDKNQSKTTEGASAAHQKSLLTRRGYQQQTLTNEVDGRFRLVESWVPGQGAQLTTEDADEYIKQREEQLWKDAIRNRLTEYQEDDPVRQALETWLKTGEQSLQEDQIRVQESWTQFVLKARSTHCVKFTPIEEENTSGINSIIYITNDVNSIGEKWDVNANRIRAAEKGNKAYTYDQRFRRNGELIQATTNSNILNPKYEARFYVNPREFYIIQDKKENILYITDTTASKMTGPQRSGPSKQINNLLSSGQTSDKRWTIHFTPEDLKPRQGSS